MADDDLPTRITLVERTMVSRDMLVDREDKLLLRMEDMLKRYITQASDDQKHQFKLFGHEMADQLRAWSAKIHLERDEIDEKRESARKDTHSAIRVNPWRAWVMANWAKAVGLAILVAALRPDLASAAFKMVF